MKDIQDGEWPFFFPSVYQEMCWCGIVLWIKLNCSRNVFRVHDIKLDTVFGKQCVTERNETKMCRTKYIQLRAKHIYTYMLLEP